MAATAVGLLSNNPTEPKITILKHGLELGAHQLFSAPGVVRRKGKEGD